MTVSQAWVAPFIHGRSATAPRPGPDALMTRRKTASAVDAPPLPATESTEIDTLVDAAMEAADELGRDIADVPITAIARHAGISRSTLLRRLGGSRTALDDAVRARGVDPGGIPPVRVRALDAAAALIAQNGLA